MPETSAEHNDRIQLAALRDLLKEQRELERLTLLEPAYVDISKVPPGNEATDLLHDTEQRIATLTRRIARLKSFLASAGWDSENLDLQGSQN